MLFVALARAPAAGEELQRRYQRLASRAYIDRVEAHVGRKEHARAVREAQRAIRLDPSSGNAYYALGYARFWGGDYRGAIRAGAEQIRINHEASGRDITLIKGSRGQLRFNEEVERLIRLSRRKEADLAIAEMRALLAELHPAPGRH